MTISEAARQTGLQASAIRYYEQIGLLPAAARMSGQRRYDTSILYRLAIIQRAQQLGFTLDEIRQLFFGFGSVTAASQRWRYRSTNGSRHRFVGQVELWSSVFCDSAKGPIDALRAMWRPKRRQKQIL